jgi:hypothetical protein
MVAADRYVRALSRVSTTTGLVLSGGGKPQRRISPRAILLAIQPRLPRGALRQATAAISNILRGRALPMRVPPVYGGAPSTPRGRVQIDSASSSARLYLWLEAASYQEQPGSFPYVDSAPQYTPQSASLTSSAGRGCRRGVPGLSWGWISVCRDSCRTTHP